MNCRGTISGVEDDSNFGSVDHEKPDHAFIKDGETLAAGHNRIRRTHISIVNYFENIMQEFQCIYFTAIVLYKEK